MTDDDDEGDEYRDRRTPTEVSIGVPGPLDVKLVNCAYCHCELLGDSESEWRNRLPAKLRTKYPPPCFRYRGRPFCFECHGEMTGVSSHNKDTLLNGLEPPKEDTTPDQDNAIRFLEDGAGE